MNRKFVLIVLIFLLIASVYSFGQCGNELKREAFAKISGGAYLKDFRVRFEQSSKKSPDKEEFTIMLFKGVRYRFVIKNDSSKPGEVVIKLYDDLKIYLSSFDEASATHHNILEFYCQKTQAYYLSGYFKNGEKGCAIIMLGNMGKF